MQNDQRDADAQHYARDQGPPQALTRQHRGESDIQRQHTSEDCKQLKRRQQMDPGNQPDRAKKECVSGAARMPCVDPDRHCNGRHGQRLGDQLRKEIVLGNFRAMDPKCAEVHSHCDRQHDRVERPGAAGRRIQDRQARRP